jgi:hypothetical protein
VALELASLVWEDLEGSGRSELGDPERTPAALAVEIELGFHATICSFGSTLESPVQAGEVS